MFAQQNARDCRLSFPLRLWELDAPAAMLMLVALHCFQAIQAAREPFQRIPLGFIRLTAEMHAPDKAVTVVCLN